ncbi:MULTISPECIES: DUF2914 domain-containing protein [Sorangium]|uniref:DUF2914 domain-containing protein n=1 Tax=Sorangium cellulosum (strain So ce56) TaxID=448385 RepID=A9GUS5_SORC5|nr:DUF2914 domain-containing protein [Sorangium cellulosum]CAN90661.1 hypothetical protein sce0504 [Sorangium cellulosum So ce56]
MAMKMARRMTFLALCTVSLAGCGERHDARPPAPAAAASPAATQCPEPAAVTAAAPASLPAAPVTAPAPDANVVADKGSKGSREAKEKGRGAAELKVKRLVIAEGVKDREPVAPGTTFHAPETPRLYAYLEVENRSDVEGEVTVAFVPPGGGEPVGNVTLGVGPSPRWRTWAFTRGARKAGEWTAVVRSETGEELARAPFEVTL